MSKLRLFPLFLLLILLITVTNAQEDSAPTLSPGDTATGVTNTDGKLEYTLEVQEGTSVELRVSPMYDVNYIIMVSSDGTYSYATATLTESNTYIARYVVEGTPPYTFTIDALNPNTTLTVAVEALAPAASNTPTVTPMEIPDGWTMLLNEDFSDDNISPVLLLQSKVAFLEENNNGFIHISEGASFNNGLQIKLGSQPEYILTMNVRLNSQPMYIYFHPYGRPCPQEAFPIAVAPTNWTSNTSRPVAGEERCEQLGLPLENSSPPEQAGQWFTLQVEVIEKRITIHADEVQVLSQPIELNHAYISVTTGDMGVDIDNITLTGNLPEKQPLTSTELQPRFNHLNRLAFDLPEGFHLEPPFTAQYVLGNHSMNIRTLGTFTSLEEACNTYYKDPGTPPTETIEYVPNDYGEMCIFMPPKELQPAFRAAIVMGLPLSDTDIQYIHIDADADLIPILVDSLHYEPNPSAPLYLQEALHYIEVNSLYLDRLDWAQVRETALSMVNENSPLEDAHAALAYVYQQFEAIGDTHGAFLLPAQYDAKVRGTFTGGGVLSLLLPEGELITLVYPDSPADRAGLKPGDLIQTINGVKPQDYVGDDSDTLTLVVQRGSETLELSLTPGEFSIDLPVTGRRLSGRIGYVETFSVDPALNVEQQIAHVNSAHQVIQEIDSAPTCGWILDLRRNKGGNPAVMGSAFAPIRGEGRWFGKTSADGETIWLSYLDGSLESTAFPITGEETIWIENPYLVKNPNPPVAVLVSPTTASMGEVTTMIFRSRPDAATRIFGEQTAGLLQDGWTGITLSDGAEIRVTSAYTVDLNGDTYPFIEPDVVMETDYSVYGTDDDPLIQAAVAWLQEQPECAVEIRIIQAGGNVNVRSGPGTNFSRLGTLPDGTEVEVVGRNESGDWLEIKFEDGTGWIAEYLAVVPE